LELDGARQVDDGAVVVALLVVSASRLLKATASFGSWRTRGARLGFIRECEGHAAVIGVKRRNFPAFSRETGKYEAEGGSPMTASTASKSFLSERNFHTIQLDVLPDGGQETDFIQVAPPSLSWLDES